MELLFWILWSLIGYTYIGYPLVVLLLSLLIDNRVRKRAIEPVVTFLITAYNEERDIAEKLENTLALDYPAEKLEVIVASDGSDDRTDEIVAAYHRRGVQLIRSDGRRGKTAMQNRAVDASRGDVIVFSDATTRYDRLAVRKLVQNFADPAVGAVSGRFRYVDPGCSPIGKGTSVFWDYESYIKLRQTKIRTITGCSGCMYAVRRSLYTPLPADIISDLVEPLAILRKGYTIVYEPDAFAYELPCTKTDDEFTMRIRVITRGMQGLLYMRKLLNPFRYGFVAFQLVSHKILRWLVPLFAVGGYALTIVLLDRGAIYYVAFCLQTAFYLLASLGWLMEYSSKKMPLLSLPLYFCVVNSASIVALVRLLMNKKDVQWKTVRY